jgi:arsenate reductase (thioredoxin)
MTGPSSSIRVRALLLAALVSGVAFPSTSSVVQADAAARGASKAVLLPQVAKYVAQLPQGFGAIPGDRKQQLDKLALFVRSKLAAGEKARLLFICTHNSRRSHMSQLWSTVAAARYGIEGVETYSGGVEVTAFNARAVAAMERAGLQIQKPEGENPHYRVGYAKNRPALEAFSKKYDDTSNPHDGFAAVMTCSQADKNCPLINGATLRVALPFEDPKVSDGTPAEAATYDERAKQIATEMFYLFSRIEPAKS